MKRITTIILSTVTILLIVSGLLVTSSAQSQEITSNASESPQDVLAPSNTLFSYQGQLMDNSGAPVNNAAMPMTFKLYNVLSGGTACWSENQTVGVQNGRFNILIGQVSPILDSCLTGDIYLELVINGETLTPRELLTSTAHAVEANTLPHDATTRGILNIAPGPDGEGGQIRLLQGNTGNEWEMDNRLGTFRLFHSGQVYFSIKSDGTVNLNNHAIENFGGLISNQANTAFTNDGGSFRWRAAESVHVFIDKDNNQAGQAFTVSANNDYFGEGLEYLFRVDETKETTVYGFLDIRGMGNASMEIGQTTTEGNLNLDLKQGNTFVFRNYTGSAPVNWLAIRSQNVRVYTDMQIDGNLNLVGSCTAQADENGFLPTSASNCASGSITSGAYVEANLMTLEERAKGHITRFVQGDLLCWSAQNERLEKCTSANDRLVMAVADTNGKPIVIGAEPIKVLGPVQAGDILVASDTPGYAIVNNTPAPGTVIGQALENFGSESGLIKAMIRKW